MILRIPNWSNFLPVIKLTFYRFPVPFVSTLLTTLLAMLLIQDSGFVSGELVEKFLVTTIYSTVALTSLKLIVESESWSARQHLVAAGIVIAVIVNYSWEILSEATATTHIFFALAVGLSLLFTPYLRRQSTAASVWLFSYQSGVAIFFAGLAGLILGIGLSLSLASIGYLFEIKIPGELYGHVWVLSWGLLFPIYVLANLSKQFELEDAACQFPRGIRFIANYILVPMMFAYMAILYAYFLKIILQWELPRGNLGWMITSFGSIGIITKLLAYPIRNDGTRLLSLFDRYYYHALIVPIVLLFIAIGVRIKDYGVTEQRYAVVLLGVWFLAVALITIFKKDRFHIIQVPMLLAALAFLASFGPWGAVEISVTSQVGRFENLLLKNNLLVNGQTVKATSPILFEERKSISSIADYLGRSDTRMERITPWFRTLIDENENKELSKIPRERSRELVQLMGLEYVNKWQKQPADNQFNYSDSFDMTQNLANVSGFDFIGQSGFYDYSQKSTQKVFQLNRKGTRETITVERNGTQLIITTEAGQTVVFDLELLIRRIRKHDSKQPQVTFKENSALTQTSVDGAVKVQLNIEQIQGKITNNDNIEINRLRYVFMLKIYE